MKIISKILVFIAVFYLFGCKRAVDSKKQDALKPNVLFILVDDLGLYDLSFTGSTYYETPNVERICSTFIENSKKRK